MVHDLRRAPLSRRCLVPVGLRAPRERPEHHLRNAGEVAHLSTASASWRACAAAGDPGLRRPTSAPALSATTRSASRTAALSVRTDNAHWWLDRKSTRLNSSHEWISYAVFCLKKKITNNGSNKLNRSRKARVSYKIQRTINASLNEPTSTRALSSHPNIVTRQKIEMDIAQRQH